MTFKTKEREIGKNVMCRKIIVDVLQCDAMCSVDSALLAEVGPTPYANRRAAVEQGVFFTSEQSSYRIVEFSKQKEGQDELTFLLSCKCCFLLCQNIMSDGASVLVFWERLLLWWILENRLNSSGNWGHFQQKWSARGEFGVCFSFLLGLFFTFLFPTFPFRERKVILRTPWLSLHAVFAFFFHTEEKLGFFQISVLQMI